MMDFETEAKAIEREILPSTHSICVERMDRCGGWCYCRHVRETITSALRKAYIKGAGAALMSLDAVSGTA